MAKPIVVKWAQMKNVVDQRGLSIQYVDLVDKYKLTVIDGPYTLIMDMSKNPSDPTDLNDFETNYKPNGNGRVREESFTADRRLRVANIATPGDPAGIPTANNNVKYFLDYYKKNPIILNAWDGVSPKQYTTIWSYNGITSLKSFKIRFNTDDIYIKLDIDGSVVFELFGEDLEDMMNEHENEFKLPFRWNKDDLDFVFNPNYAIDVKNSITISAISANNETNRKVYGHFVELLK